MILEYRGMDLWDDATGDAILQALGDELAPPPVAAALAGADVDPLDLTLGLVTLAGMLSDAPKLGVAIGLAATNVGDLIEPEAAA